MKTNQQIALEVISGKWGTGKERREMLKNAGYNPDAVQSIVNALMSGSDFVVQDNDFLEVKVTKNMKGLKIYFED